MAAKGITYDDILRDLKAKKVAPVYYLMGDEDYFIDKLSDAIVEAVLTEDEKDFNLDILYGAEAEMDKVIELAHAYPMMAEKRVVLVREAQAMRSIEGLETYLAHLTPQQSLSFATSTANSTHAKPLPKPFSKSASSTKVNVSTTIRSHPSSRNIFINIMSMSSPKPSKCLPVM